MNSVPKGEFDGRIIVDLGWPTGSTVNYGIPSKQYLGVEFQSVYPTVDDIAARILALDPGHLLFKRDLKRAYRQFPVDPGDYHLLGYSWQNQMFFDTVWPMGLRSAVKACQRITWVCFSQEQKRKYTILYTCLRLKYCLFCRTINYTLKLFIKVQ